MKALRNFLSILFPIMLITGNMNAQVLSSPEPLRPSTDVWETIKYGDISPSLYTGTVNVSIPFYTYKDADFEIPISFAYSSNGLHPNERAGSMGMGWRLVAGGCISREMRGSADDEYMTFDDGGGTVYSIKGFSFLDDFGITPSRYYLYAHGPLGPIDSQCFYYDHDNAIFVDAEPDIFHFDFMGCIGSFMFDPTESIIVYDTNDNPLSIKVDHDISFSQDKCSFVITTGDAYRYEFDGEVNSNENNLEYTVINDNPVILAWHLSRIIAPNGRTVSFTYERGPYVVGYRPNTMSYTINTRFWNPQGETRTSDFKSRVAGGTYSANLTSIAVDGITIADFTYDSINEKCLANIAEDQSMTVVGSDVLTDITVSYGNSIIRSCSMSYTFSNNPGQRRFLTSLDVSGEGTYSMTYESPQSVPMYGTFMIDHWDYYNARYDADVSAFLNVSTLSSDGNTETYTPNNVREPAFLPSKYGILTRIEYPTGGYSSFTYEPHDYSKAQLRQYIYAFDPVVISESGTAGGVRIKSIENCSPSGAVLSKKTYSYARNGESTGILLNKPRYRVDFSFDWSSLHFVSSNSSSAVDESMINVTNTNSFSSPSSSLITNNVYLWTNNLTRYNSTHIEYTSVTETSLDGSSTKYSFTSALDYPDSIQSDESLPHKIPGVTPQYDIYWTVSGLLSRLFFLTSAQSLRGRVTEVQRYNGSTVVASSSTGYEEINQSAITTDDGMYSYVPVSSPATIDMIGIYTGREDITSREWSQYFGSTAVTSKEEISYNNWYQPSQITATDSRGQRTRIKHQYVTDDLTGMNATVFNCGIIDAPISERKYEVSASGAETLLSRTSWTYTRPDASAHPNLVRVASMNVRDERSNKTLVTNYTYDSYGHLVQKMDPDISFTTYIWGYGGMYPVAEIKGITLSQVRSISGLSNINTTPLPGSVASFEVALRALSGAQVTTYEYIPLIGLTKVTGPDGRSESYDYNASGKLRHVFDDLLHRVSAHYYSADHESTAVNSND